MKRNLMYLVASATVFASCSNETIVDSQINQQSNRIGFSTYKTVTKGNPIDNNPEFLTKQEGFGVMAFISDNNAPYMGTTNEGVNIIPLKSSWIYANNAELAYWPTKEETLDFYAYYPYNHSSISDKVFSKNKGIAFKYTVPAVEANQVDLMFASATGQSKPTGSNAVQLNFKHALTQIHFKVATKTERLKVDIEADGIQIHNINSVANFVLPKVETEKAWSNWSAPVNYTVTCSAITGEFVGYGTEESKTTYKPVNTTDAVLMLIPQVVNPWTPAENENMPPQNTSGAYLSVSCKIYQDLGNDEKVYLVGEDDSFGKVYIPFSSKKDDSEVWNRSKKVTYNLLIGGGTTLNPIEFETVVDNWVDADGGVIENQ